MRNTTRAVAIDPLEPRRSSLAVAAGLALAALAAGCSSNSEPADKASRTPSPFVVSSPVPNAAGIHSNTGVTPHSTSAASTVVYISLPPGAMPAGVTVTIADAHLGSSVSAAFVDGGFDPVSLAADAGDTLTFTVRRADTTSVTYMRAVPGDGPPIVVRTSPPVHKRDVPLNSIMVVVFSEPIDAASLKVGAIQLWRRGDFSVRSPCGGRSLHLTATLRARQRTRGTYRVRTASHAGRNRTRWHAAQGACGRAIHYGGGGHPLPISRLAEQCRACRARAWCCKTAVPIRSR